MKQRKGGGQSKHKDVLAAEASAYALVCKQLDWLFNWSIDSRCDHTSGLPAPPIVPETSRLADVVAACRSAQIEAIALMDRYEPTPDRTELELAVVLLTLRGLIERYAKRAERAIEESVTRRPGRPKASGAIVSLSSGNEVEFYSAQTLKIIESLMSKSRRSAVRPDNDIDTYNAVEAKRAQLSPDQETKATVTAAINALIDSGAEPHHERERQFNSLRARHARGKRKSRRVQG